MPVNFTCENCNVNVSRPKHGSQTSSFKFCTRNCRYEYYKVNNTVTRPCDNCNKITTRTLSQYKRTKDKIFCSQSCAGIYNQSHKTKGTRVSKLELYLQSELIKLYKDIKFLFNDRTAINSELDIYIPELKLAFELNGIFHYEPIYGQEKLSQIRNNDDRKFQACLNENIELVIIDSSSFKYFKVGNANKYLSIITSIINRKRDLDRI